ncbi:hypothetical protein [Sphingomonas hylomeconis]|uniref:DUF2029 domain-containing protein n=1 Tax=Sphingomonas hylomeconis TaxID=1395958 RepID=A0ABV7SXF4_9SPHN|nr:hypothetical protein [Sphingomonas hylomeconis]
MSRPLTPLWLSAPSRFAALKPIPARWGLALLVLVLAASLTALASPGPPPVSHSPATRADDMADVVLYESIVSGVRAGGNYYAVTAAALRTGNYPLRPFITFRLPTLAMVQSLLPAPVTIALLYLLAAGVLLAWFVRLRPAFARAPPRAIAVILLAGGMAAFVQADLVGFHEVWAGLLIALSLALRKPNRWVEAAAFGMIAMLIRETAVLYVGIMAMLAFAEGHRREAWGWVATLAIFAVVVTLHAYAVSQVVRPLDPTSPGWSGLLGFGFFVKTMTISTALNLAPAWLAALLVGLTLFGWAAWRDPLALRALATIGAYALLLGLFGRTDTFYWGLMIAPTILIGLAFLPDGLRDLIVAARDRRRITVTRMIR